jgi:SH3-like domain-containing protein
MKIWVNILILVAALSFQAVAQSEIRCAIDANLIDTDANGTNVRKGAGKEFSVIGNLPTDRTDVVTIVASNGPWVKISKAVDQDDETVFDKEGWVFASLLGMMIARNPDDKKGQQRLFYESNKKSRVLARLPAEASVILVGCSGPWAHVKYHGSIGWLAPDAQCTNTRSTCS